MPTGVSGDENSKLLTALTLERDGLRAKLDGYSDLGGQYKELKEKYDAVCQKLQKLAQPKQTFDIKTSYHEEDFLSSSTDSRAINRNVTPSDVNISLGSQQSPSHSKEATIQTSNHASTNSSYSHPVTPHATHLQNGDAAHESPNTNNHIQTSNGKVGTAENGHGNVAVLQAAAMIVSSKHHRESSNAKSILASPRSSGSDSDHQPSYASSEQLGEEVTEDSDMEPTPNEPATSNGFVLLSTHDHSNSLSPLPSISDSHRSRHKHNSAQSNDMLHVLSNGDHLSVHSHRIDDNHRTETLHSISTSLHRLNSTDDDNIQVPIVTNALRQISQVDPNPKVLDEFARLFVGINHKDEQLKKTRNSKKILEQRCKTQQTDLIKANLEISHLSSECEMLKKQVKQMEQQTNPSVDTSTPSGGGWVTVERKDSPPEKEMELVTKATKEDKKDSNKPDAQKRQINLLNTQVKELLEVNHQWDQHCKEKDKEYKKTIQQLNAEIAEYKKALDDHRKQETKRQKDIDAMLIASKKKVDDMEMEKEDALHNHQMEKSRGDTLNERLQLAERQLTTLKETQQRSAYSQRSPSADRELRDQIELLKHQVTIYQDDFNREREDRERIQGEKVQLREQNETLSNDLRTSNAQIDLLNEEITARSYLIDNHEATINQCREELQRLTRQLETLRNISQQQQQQLQQQLRHNHLPHEQHEPNFGQPNIGHYERYLPMQDPEYRQWSPSSPSQVRHPKASTRLDWNCEWCTYLNPIRRTTCEICGALNEQRRRGSSNTPITVQNIQEREFKRAKQGSRRLVSRAGDLQIDGEDDEDQTSHIENS